jgi:isopentenyl-diphosphate delta-isomerase type 1
MEFVDIVDENDILTGEVMKKKLAHKEGKYHRTAHIWIINEKGEILLQKRSNLNRTHPNCWDISAVGHIRTGESVKEGALRELKEEIGVIACEKDLVYITKNEKKTNPQNKEFAYIYLIETRLKVNEYKFEDAEVSEVKYVYYKDFEKMIKNKDIDLLLRGDEYKVVFKYINDKFKKE